MQWPFIALTFVGVNWFLWKWVQDSEGETIADRLWWLAWGEWLWAFMPDWLFALLLFAFVNALMLYGTFYQLPETVQMDILNFWNDNFAALFSLI